MVVSINQPAYLPWLGYFHRIACSDLHIVLDRVQFEKNSFTNRNKVRTKAGWCWLTVPVATSGKFGDLGIDHIEVAAEARWAAKHWATLYVNYRKTRYFAEHSVFFEQLYRQPWRLLNDLTSEATAYLLKSFGIVTPVRVSSRMAATGRKQDLILNLCQEVGATVYLSGPFGRDYLQEAAFRDAGIKVRYQDYRHPTYPQAYAGFEPFMAAVDLLFNCGSESLNVMMQGQATL